MVIIGTNVASLYPNLKISRVVEAVSKVVMDSRVTWEEIDYLEGARYVALNWLVAKCRSSAIARVLPWRRNTRGTRPGLTGSGPLGVIRNSGFFHVSG